MVPFPGLLCKMFQVKPQSPQTPLAVPRSWKTYAPARGSGVWGGETVVLRELNGCECSSAALAPFSPLLASSGWRQTLTTAVWADRMLSSDLPSPKFKTYLIPLSLPPEACHPFACGNLVCNEPFSSQVPRTPHHNQKVDHFVGSAKALELARTFFLAFLSLSSF